jgi:hypothetical protein
MDFKPRHVVAMVVGVCAAAVLAPVGVMAASGTLTNIVDPYDGNRAARVTRRGTLWVESRAGVASDSFTVLHETKTDVTPYLVKATTSRIAVTSWVVTVHGDNTASTNHFRLISTVRLSGTSACGGAGWSAAKTIATIAVRAGSTEQLLWNGPPLVVETPPAGQLVCLRVQQTKWTGSTDSDMAVTGFAFT